MHQLIIEPGPVGAPINGISATRIIECFVGVWNYCVTLTSEAEELARMKS